MWQLVWVIYRLDLKKTSCCHTMLVYKSCWLIEFIVVFLCSFFPWQLRIPSLHGGLNVAWSIEQHPTYLGLRLVMDWVSKGVCKWLLMSCVKSSKMNENEEKVSFNLHPTHILHQFFGSKTRFLIPYPSLLLRPPKVLYSKVMKV